MDFYKNHFTPTNEFSKIILCGGGAYFQKIDKYISSQLKLPIVLGNPLQTIDKKNLKQIKFPTQRSLSFTPAIGLALRGIQKDNLI